MGDLGSLLRKLDEIETPKTEEKMDEIEAPVREDAGQEVDRIAFPKIGEVYPAKIVTIRFGTMLDFFDPARIRNEEFRKRLLYEKGEDPAILVKFVVEELGTIGRVVLRISTHERSNYMQLSRCYKELAKGSTIWVQLKPNGRWEIVCPPPSPQ